MQEKDWGLPQLPFGDSLDPRIVQESPAYEEALARLQFVVDSRRRLGLLLGPPGSGKSLLLTVLSRQLRREAHAIVLASLLGLDVDELIWTIAAQLGTNPRAEAPRFRLWRAVADRLAEQRYQRQGTVILLDDADDASPDVLTHVLRLLHLDRLPDARLTVILAAERSRAGRLGRRLLDLAELRIELEPWQPEETLNYVQRCLHEAGGDGPAFDQPAALRLHQLGEGRPRQINQLAQLAYLAGKGQQLASVDERTVESVYRELNVAPLASAED